MANDSNQVLGWHEWLALPELNIQQIKAKIDTGARTSALHAFYCEPFEKNNQEWVRFGMHPEQDNTDIEQVCEAQIIDNRTVTDSGGHKEQRFVILTTVVVADVTKKIEITLTDRDTMKYRMLLGRTGIPKGMLVNPHASHLIGSAD